MFREKTLKNVKVINILDKSAAMKMRKIIFLFLVFFVDKTIDLVFSEK